MTAAGASLLAPEVLDGASTAEKEPGQSHTNRRSQLTSAAPTALGDPQVVAEAMGCKTPADASAIFSTGRCWMVVLSRWLFLADG